MLALYLRGTSSATPRSARAQALSTCCTVGLQVSFVGLG